MGRPNESLSDFLTFISPICIIVLFFLCLFRFLFSCCACKLRPTRLGRETANAASVETGLPNSMVTAPNLHMPPLPLNYIEYDSNLYPSPFLFSTDQFPAPPKYEHAIKLPSATPRRSSSSVLPPPFYDNSCMDQNDFTCQPPAYYSVSQETSLPGIRPTASGISTISGQNTTNNAFLAAIPVPSVSASNAPVELSPTMLAEKRLRVGINAVRHASFNSQDQLTSTPNNRPITSLRTRDPPSNASQQRPFTMHSRYLPHTMPSLPGQITGSTQSMNESSDSEKTGQ